MKTKLIATMAVVLLCGATQATLISASLSGNAFGDLNGVAFNAENFTWTIVYDNTSFLSTLGVTQPVFNNITSSIITLQNTASPINITAEHALYVNTGGGKLDLAMMTISGTTIGNNILAVEQAEGIAWDGIAEYSTAGGLTGDFAGVSSIATDQGGLNMIFGTIGSFDAIEAVPEPATAGLLGISALVLFVMRRHFCA